MPAIDEAEMIPDEEQEEPKVDSLKEIVAFPTYWDGNCFFRAMITYAADIEHAARYTKTGEPWLVKERAKLLQRANALRKQAVEYAVDHGLADLAEEEGWAQSLRENGAWADEVAILATTRTPASCTTRSMARRRPTRW